MPLTWKLRLPCVALGLIATGLHAQGIDAARLKNWPAPLSWQPTTPSELEAVRVREASEYRITPQMAAPGGGGAQYNVLVAVTPCRLLDTRSNMPGIYGSSTYPGYQIWSAGSTHSIAVPGAPLGTYSAPGVASFTPCSLPSAMAYSANITVVPPAGMTFTFLAVCPTGTPAVTCQAATALTGYEGNTAGAGNIVGNAAVIPANAAGSFDLWINSQTAVVIDINGYYVSPGALMLGPGTAAAPAISFTGDASSGIYSSAAGTINIASSGINSLTISSNGLDVAGDMNLSGVVRFQGSAGLAISAANGNTAAGALALGVNSGGSNNSGLGYNALAFNSSGSQNTAAGGYALYFNNTGKYNTAQGYGALQSNTSGNYSTGVGYNALATFSGAGYNPATGAYALYADTIGQNNTATGYYALGHATTGGQNTAAGYNALYSNAIGNNNTAAGFNALYFNTGSNNIALGYQAGYYVVAGNDNIHIGNPGVSSDSGAVRIGASGTQKSFFAAGIRDVVTGAGDAIPVVIDSNGQMGTVSSSGTVKRDIRDLGDTTAVLMGLRPVRFRYKSQGPDAAEHYGLVAEEVAKVAPELVVRKPDGAIETVYYDKVGMLVLNELQNQHRIIESQAEVISRLEARLAKLNSGTCN